MKKIKIGFLTNIQIAIIGIVVFSLFYFRYGDENYKVKRALKYELDSLTNHVDSLRNKIYKDSLMIERLKNDNKYLEKYARETFYMHKEGEEVFIWGN
ncbi:MAG: septum formation initiator family protein [Rikenellaceae bacterium]